MCIRDRYQRRVRGLAALRDVREGNPRTTAPHTAQHSLSHPPLGAPIADGSKMEVVVVLSSDSDNEVQIVEQIPAVRRKRRRAQLSGKNGVVDQAAHFVVDLTTETPQSPLRAPKHRNQTGASGEPASLRNNCAICLETIPSQSMASTKCGHVFCFECIKAAVAANKSCPTCRCKLTKTGFHRLYL
eukprot:TRINITY_DN26662_c0_g1_i1.p1 TRINITY_DN26662_c0_g1~~TRINITY_DN26662_c0_g1_i1.p1  ORF type:complete len:186 (+),score=33.36 TRINITY_DN26662_c0_g1_i1:78-635(+)